MVREEVPGHVLSRSGARRACHRRGGDGDGAGRAGLAGHQRQYSGTAGRTENCQVGTFLAYVSVHGHALLARRSISDPAEIACYACYGPRRSRLVGLAWIAGSRWHIEECFQQAKGEAGLDHYQVRSRRAWYAHITLSMLALAWLAASRSQAKKGRPAPATRA
jgi:SRSO17 transposase